MKELIIFIVGGLTYEESLAVHNFNTNPMNRGKRSVLLGGTTILNSSDFIKEVCSNNYPSLCAISLHLHSHTAVSCIDWTFPPRKCAWGIHMR